MFDEQRYREKTEALFARFPSVQKYGFAKAYKPGLERMERFDEALGSPSKSLKAIHIAGTNGKGSVANMLASALSAKGMKVGLYTSPHLLDFRERIIVSGEGMITKEGVWDFLEAYDPVCDALDLSFFEITTGMALNWFIKRQVDVAVMETGLGGRLDSTNIITPELSVITSIGLDHCSLLGDTLEAIAAEKAGIIKPGVPVVAGSRNAHSAAVFEQRAEELHSPLIFADSVEPPLWDRRAEMIGSMDLQGPCQGENLRTVLAALDVLGLSKDHDSSVIEQAIIHTAERMGFRGRWELLSREPDVICDIGHNPPALKINFARLEQLLREGRYDGLIIVYGVMADKDFSGIIPLMPPEARYVFVTPETERALDAETIYRQLAEKRGNSEKLFVGGGVREGVEMALKMAAQARSEGREELIYIGGSTFVVCEAMSCVKP